MDLSGQDVIEVEALIVRLVTDQDDDHFYAWLSMYDQKGQPHVELLKASADLDCEDEGGATFLDWQQRDGWRIPQRRSWVKNLAEQTVADYVVKEVAADSRVDETIFSIDSVSGNSSQ